MSPSHEVVSRAADLEVIDKAAGLAKDSAFAVLNVRLLATSARDRAAAAQQKEVADLELRSSLQVAVSRERGMLQLVVPGFSAVATERDQLKVALAKLLLAMDFVTLDGNCEPPVLRPSAPRRVLPVAGSVLGSPGDEAVSGGVAGLAVVRASDGWDSLLAAITGVSVGLLVSRAGQASTSARDGLRDAAELAKVNLDLDVAIMELARLRDTSLTQIMDHDQEVGAALVYADELEAAMSVRKELFGGAGGWGWGRAVGDWGRLS